MLRTLSKYFHFNTTFSKYFYFIRFKGDFNGLYTLNIIIDLGVSTNARVISLEIGSCNKFLEGLAWFTKKSKEFNQYDFASHLTQLTLTLSVDGS